MSSNGKAPFICRVVRLQHALTNDTRPTTGHAAHCAHCHAYYRASETLLQTLHRDASREMQPPSDNIAARIAQAVRQSAPPPRRSRLPAAFSTFAGVAAIVALSFFVIRQNEPLRPVKTQNLANTELSPADLNELAISANQLRTHILDLVEPAAVQLSTNNPLKQEIDSAQAVAHAALSFFALNFLPADSARHLESLRTPSSG